MSDSRCGSLSYTIMSELLVAVPAIAHPSILVSRLSHVSG